MAALALDNSPVHVDDVSETSQQWTCDAESFGEGDQYHAHERNAPDATQERPNLFMEEEDDTSSRESRSRFSPFAFQDGHDGIFVWHCSITSI
jgi:hypothetical protein